MDPRTLGDYQIIKPLGQGTLGMVFLAEHRFMKKHYVLKVLPEELASDRTFVQRFEEEVGGLASLDHPNIVKIYNISFSKGQYFIVTDCIVDALGESTNLTQYLTGLERKLEEDELFQILKQVAEALDYIHSKKIGNQQLVHRGLKLNNILVGKKSQKVDVYLTDCGISRIIGAGAVLTRTYKNVADALNIGMSLIAQKAGQDYYPNPPIEQQKLTPLHTSFLQNYAFLAPEQKRLDTPYPVGIQTDTYAFGVLVYFLLMNELPEGIFEMPSMKSQYRYQWDSLIQQCLQSRPSQRPAKLASLLDSILTVHPYVSDFLTVNKIEPLKDSESFVEKVVAPFANESTLLNESTTNEIFKEEESFSPPLPTNNQSNVAVEEIVHLLQEEPLKEQVESLPKLNNQDPVLLKKSEQPIIPSIVPEKEISIKEPENVASTTLKPFLQISQLDRPQTDMDPGAIFQVHSSVKSYHPEPKDVTNIKPLLTDMVIIPGGVFSRGSLDGNRDEMPKHQISLDSFAIDIHPVSNEQFVRFLEVMGGEKDLHHNDIIRLRDSRIKRSGGKLSIESGYNKHPVVGVTWYGAVAYAKWVGKRLPTEAEWEVAARGGNENLFYPVGDDIEKTQANFFSSDTTAVMSYVPNGYGIYDMSGNVYEWCYDWYGYNYYEISVQEPDNPKGPLQGVYRVLRGGCWKSLKEDLRCSRRHRNNPGTVNGTYGFRCVAKAEISA